MKKLLVSLGFAFALLCGSAQAQSGQQHFLSAATTNSTSVTATRASVYLIVVSNHFTASRFLKLYDKATAPTCGTDTPVKTIEVGGVTTSPTATTLVIPNPIGSLFKSGIGFCITGVGTDADTTAVGANEVTLDLDYR